MAVIPLHTLAGGPEAIDTTIAAIRECRYSVPEYLVKAVEAYKAADAYADDGLALLLLESLFAAIACADRDTVATRLAETLITFWGDEHRRMQAQAN